MATTATESTMQAKIQALLAKAESTEFPAEAEALSRKAEALMIKWGIDEAMLAAERAGKGATVTEDIVEQHMEFTGRFAKALVLFGHNIALALELRTLTSPGYGDKPSRPVKRLHLIGHASDVARAQMLITSLQLQLVTAQRVWWKNLDVRAHLSQSEGNRAKREFMYGFANAVARRLRETRRDQATATQTTAGPSVALVLRDRRAEVDEWVNAKYKNLGKSRGGSTKGSAYGRAEGAAAGRQANLGGTSVKGGATGALGA